MWNSAFSPSLLFISTSSSSSFYCRTTSYAWRVEWLFLFHLDYDVFCLTFIQLVLTYEPQILFLSPLFFFPLNQKTNSQTIVIFKIKKLKLTFFLKQTSSAHQFLYNLRLDKSLYLIVKLVAQSFIFYIYFNYCYIMKRL